MLYDVKTYKSHSTSCNEFIRPQEYIEFIQKSITDNVLDRINPPESIRIINWYNTEKIAYKDYYRSVIPCSSRSTGEY